MMRTSSYTYDRKSTNTGKIYIKDIPQDLKDEIIMYWKTSKINSAPVLAGIFGFTPYLINSILNEHLNNLKKG